MAHRFLLVPDQLKLLVPPQIRVPEQRLHHSLLLLLLLSPHRLILNRRSLLMMLMAMHPRNHLQFKLLHHQQPYSVSLLLVPNQREILFPPVHCQVLLLVVHCQVLLLVFHLPFLLPDHLYPPRHAKLLSPTLSVPDYLDGDHQCKLLLFSSTASTSSTWGSVQAPVQASAPNTASAFPPPFSYPGAGCLARPNVGLSQIVSSPFVPTHDFGVCASRTTPKDPFPGFSVDYLPRGPSGPHPQTTTPVSGGGTEQGCRYPRYSPTPDFDSSGGPAKLVMSISASNSHGHKSHEELRWEDYKNGDKGGVGSFPPHAHKPRKESRWEDYKNGDKGGFGWYPPPHHSPSLFASPSIPHRRPQMRTIVQPHGDMSSFPFGYKYIGQRPPD
ncbi:unnamed protein product [Brassica napus]|uniref:(rape) hypothetical protein n=1 Tax=Brassica napus TaxID=3708 RepID=A0A816J206_BRANA|nr:unnamed protein product [Brassica napus]